MNLKSLKQILCLVIIIYINNNGNCKPEYIEINDILDKISSISHKYQDDINEYIIDFQFLMKLYHV